MSFPHAFGGNPFMAMMDARQKHSGMTIKSKEPVIPNPTLLLFVG
jgi:hypothetical protein